MSRRLPTPGPDQGSYVQFQLSVAQSDWQPSPPPPPPPQDPRQAASRKLNERMPKNKDEWQKARQKHHFETPEDVYRTVSSLVQDVDDGLLPRHLRRFVCLAVCCVDHHCGDKETAYSNYRARFGREVKELTIDNYMHLARSVIGLMDELYPTLRHLAFEGVLLFASLSLSDLGYYRQEPAEFKSCFPQINIVPEEHASLALYPPFLVISRRPEYWDKYEMVCEALNIRCLPKAELLMFTSVLESKKPVPHALPSPHTPRKRVYDMARDIWVDKDDANSTTCLDTEVMFPISDRIDGYKVFRIPETIQQEAASAGKIQDDCVRQDLRNAVVFRFGWSSCHSIVAKHIYDELEVQLGILSPGIVHGNQFYFRHDSGATRIPNGWVCVIIPTILTIERVTITLSYGDVQEDIVWCNGSGLLLGPGTTLSVPNVVYYISISFPY
ncbi:hypothetical protein NCS57_00949100 [Fusarium keratoplasticum]|uniref:Uncharacterized protein n=1 Tax=Fusarium keratoplasticum TaxID=1328300 RepID=A0ACC0QQM2_9HYPO|nr:hypothetical protein NCS57_00949100 [Fusarium keratoplasticum]KAI8663480.1 hypothetical protein NCS57_00949100 [Fusarium keratoplasticum]